MTTGKTYKKPWHLWVVVACLGWGMLGACPAEAQTYAGSIGGVVKDSSGAVIPGVRVVVTDKATRVSVNTETNGAGIYQVPFLNSSTYQVAFTKEGFKTDVEENVPLVLNQQAHVDAVLQVGNTAQSITVTSAPPQLDQASPMIGASISNADLLKFPEAIGSHGPNELSYVKIFPGMSGVQPQL